MKAYGTQAILENITFEGGTCTNHDIAIEALFLLNSRKYIFFVWGPEFCENFIFLILYLFFARLAFVLAFEGLCIWEVSKVCLNAQKFSID